MFCLCPPRVCLPSRVQFLQSNPTWHALEKEMSTHYSIFTWKITGTEEPGGLPSIGSHRVGHDCSDLAAAAAAFKIKFPGSSQFLWQIPRLGNLLWAPKLLQQWDNFFYIIVLQFVGHQLGDSMVGLIQTSFKMIYATGSTPRSVEIRVPVPMAGYCWSMPPQETLRYLRGRSGSVSVWSLGTGMHKVLLDPSEHLWQLGGLILNAILPLLVSCWIFCFALGHEVSFFGRIQLSLINDCSEVAVLEFS